MPSGRKSCNEIKSSRCKIAADLLDTVHRHRRRGGSGGNALGPKRKSYENGRHASLFSGASLCGYSVSGFDLFRFCTFDCERADQSDCRSSAVSQAQIGHLLSEKEFCEETPLRNSRAFSHGFIWHAEIFRKEAKVRGGWQNQAARFAIQYRKVTWAYARRIPAQFHFRPPGQF